MRPSTPTRTPADACKSFLPKLCNAMEAMQPDYETASLVTILWWSVVLGLLMRLATAILRISAGRTGTESPRPRDAMPGRLAASERPAPEAALPSRAATAPRAGRTQRPRMPQAAPMTTAEQNLVPPNLVPTGIMPARACPGPRHARPLAAIHAHDPPLFQKFDAIASHVRTPILLRYRNELRYALARWGGLHPPYMAPSTARRETSHEGCTMSTTTEQPAKAAPAHRPNHTARRLDPLPWRITPKLAA